MQVKKQQLELDMEQPTGSTLGKEYIKAVYCHPMQSILKEISPSSLEGLMLKLKLQYFGHFM